MQGLPDALEALARHAPAVLDLALAHPNLLEEALRRDPRAPLDRAGLEARWRALLQLPWEVLPSALRRERHLALIRIALREAWELGDVRERAAEWSEVADACVQTALQAARDTEEAHSSGPIRAADGSPIGLVALGMGKLAGRELNLGSDVDLCFFFERDDGADPAAPPFQRFTRVVRDAVRLIGEVTADGFCFRVDLRLRPEGRSGPLVNSLAAAERYYETWGRPWERAAMLRARPVAGDRLLGAELLRRLEPFVFPHRVDPRIVEDLAAMLLRARRLAAADERDVKLGPGGIREAEFFVQGLQLVWGGQHPEVRDPGTLEALGKLLGSGLVTAREARSLRDGWLLLRRVEHRIHLSAPHPTHRIPEDPSERERLATSLGYGSFAALRDALQEARHEIAALFASIRPSRAPEPDADSPFALLLARLHEAEPIEEDALHLLAGGDPDGPEEALAHLRRLARRADAPLGTVTVSRYPNFAARLLREVADSAEPVAALRGLAAFFSRCGPADIYVRLLDRSPRALRRLVALLGSSPAMAHLLMGHPESLDELLARVRPPTPEEIHAVHAERLPRSPRDAPPEGFVAVARGLQRDASLAIGMAYAHGELDAQGIAAPLTALAEAQVRGALRYAAAERGVTEGLAVVGLGKLGAAEMGFGSDLDLLFVHASEADPGRCIRTAQRTLHLLSTADAAGPAYRVDTRLRPGGRHGLLVVSLPALERYHLTEAEAWERMAMLRARVVAGTGSLRTRLESTLLRLPFERPPPEPGEVAALRKRIQLELAAERADRYHPKLGFGALLDVEFLVQVLQMRHAGACSPPRARSTSLAFGFLVQEGLLEPAEAARLSDALRFFRGVLQALRFHAPASEPFLRPGGPGAEHVARRMGLRPGAHGSPGERLVGRWRREARYVRTRFERHLAPVGAPPPWPQEASS